MNYLERVQEREKELDLLRIRQDADRDLLYLAKYVMRDKDKKIIPDIINATLNRPAVFATNVIAAMGKATQQITIESEDVSFDTHFIEQFGKMVLMVANQRLRAKGKWPLGAFLDEQLCIRGGFAARVISQKINGVFVPDITPWDFRYTTWENDDKGLEYAAYGSNTLRPAALISAEYGVKVKGQQGLVVDVWDREHNEVWIDGKVAREQKHSFGFTPVVVRGVPFGSMLQDYNAIEHQYESIFALIRDVIPELNRLLSIMQTLTLKAVKPPMKVKKAGAGKAPKYEDITGMGSSTAMDINEDVAPIDYGDAKRAAEIAYGMLDKAIQEGSLNSFDTGTFSQPMSAIALIQIGEGRDQVFAPRLDTKSAGIEDTLDMVSRQAMKIGGKIKMGQEGHLSDWDTSKLKGEYTTRVQYFPKSPQIDMARFSMAAAVGDLISNRSKRVEILQREDPDRDEDELRWQQAEELVPAVKLNRIIESLKDMSDRGDETADFEAELVSAAMGAELQAMLTLQGGALPTSQKPKGSQMLPAFPTTESQAAKTSSDLAKTPQMAAGE